MVRGFLLAIVCTLFLGLLVQLWLSWDVFFFNQCHGVEFGSLSFWYFSIDINLSFLLNQLSLLFAILVTIIGLSTNVYALNYFKNEADEGLFLFWLNAFIISMLLLILGDNLFTIFLGWELIGLASFFLINFWVNRRGTLKSSFKAFAFNAVSDLFLLISFVSLFIATGSTSISDMEFLTLLFFSDFQYYLYVGGLSLLVCASIKSVQFLGHLWLPDSMEAPVPASSLIHSATLVSAGVFLLLKFNFLFQVTGLEKYIFLLGALSCAYGGVVALVQTDMKKLLAYSTMSHCGFLYICVYLNNIYLVSVYLILHGIFKAATFYCVGTFIRVFKTQDSRLMGSASRLLFFETMLLILCSVNLGGFPFLVGYFYKVFFFKLLLSSSFYFLPIGFIVIGLLCSVIYVFRLVYYSCFDILKSSAVKIIFYVQRSAYSISKSYTLSTDVTLLGIIILFTFSFSIGILTAYYYFFNIIDFSTIFYGTSSLTPICGDYETIYSYYFLVFYYCYLLVIWVIVFLFFRNNILVNEMLFYYLTIYLSICILLVINL